VLTISHDWLKAEKKQKIPYFPGMIFAVFVDILYDSMVFKCRDAEMCQTEKRKHQRLPLQLDLLCQRVGMDGNDVYTGKTMNVSTGGVLFRVVEGKLKCDDLLNVELTVPPTEGLLELGGKVSTLARVIRVHAPKSVSSLQSHHAVAAEFLECPKFRG
jgi:hypothetical protein